MGSNSLLETCACFEVHLEFVSDLFHYLIGSKNCSLLIIKGIKGSCIKFLCFEKTANNYREVGN